MEPLTSSADAGAQAVIRSVELISSARREESRLKSRYKKPTKFPAVDSRLCQALLVGLLKFEQVNKQTDSFMDVSADAFLPHDKAVLLVNTTFDLG
jgi:hypothetical protein